MVVENHDLPSITSPIDVRDDRFVTSNGAYPSFQRQRITPPLSKPSSIPPSLCDDYPNLYPRSPLTVDLRGLFEENILAKVHRTGTRALGVKEESDINSPSEKRGSTYSSPKGFPEYVPQEGNGAGSYVLREPEFWTCGFFPGSLHGILERLIKFPRSIQPYYSRTLDVDQQFPDITQLRSEFTRLCDVWTEPLHAMANRTNTHDLGFIIMPALRQSWELTSNPKSLESIKCAAENLASRFAPSAGAIRSWDARIQKNIQITCKEKNFIIIIDSMCNLDLLYYASSHCSNGSHLYDVATAHATTLLRTHLRPEYVSPTSADAYRGQWYSAQHVVNLDPKTGSIQRRFTAQGYLDDSTWARGQAWAILGYAQTYMWTKDKKFLQASCGLAEYFLYRLKMGPAFVDTGAPENIIDAASCRHHGGLFVPLWDFDAPADDPESTIRDSSAGAIAANGMLILSQALAGLGYDKLAARFRKHALDLGRDLINFALAPETARFVRGIDGELEVQDVVPGQSFESILKFGTANNNENARKRYANHGLVYGDYYLIEFGNKLLRMGLD